jgi:DNA-binding response OmpR family regulator
LAHAAAISPDLIIINRQLPDGDGAALIQPLRTRLGGESVRIIVLTDSPHTIEPAATGGTAATDYLALPGSLPILRTRVRTWLGAPSCWTRHGLSASRGASHAPISEHALQVLLARDHLL